MNDDCMATTYGPMGAIGPSGAQHTHQYGAVGANGPPGPTATVKHNTSFISVNNNNNKEVMRITADGNVEWYGKPSEAAESLRRVLENLVDERIKPSTRQRMYSNACRSILSRIKDMDKEEIIVFLERSIEHREGKAVLMALQEIEEFGNEGSSK